MILVGKKTGILRDRTMDAKLMYIINDAEQNYPFL